MLATLVFLALPALADTGTPPPPPIVGGQPVSPGDWPDAAGIVFDGHSVECTGVLVAPRVALTAGHCVGGISHVLLGVVDYTSSKAEWVEVQRTFEYPDSWNTIDIAALLLAEPAETEPRLMARGCVLEDLVDGADATIVGYGAHNEWGTEYDAIKREAFISINDADCSRIQDGCNRSVSPGGELSAGGDGVDTCYGDSGGPLYLTTDHGDYLAGITSRAYSWVTVPCSDGGIYGRPDAVIEWIEQVTGQELPVPDCSTNHPPAPTAPVLYVKKNDSASGPIHPHDPDEGDHHGFEVATAPAHGELTVVAGRATYTPERGYVGADVASILVTDDGEPPLSAEVALTIEVLKGKDYRELTGEGCGCASGAAGGWALVGILPLWWRRRRSWTSTAP